MSTINLLKPSDFPPLLQEINDPPKELYLRGIIPDPNAFTYLTVVGSRQPSSYGKQVCKHLISHLQGLPVVIVSGLALGIDYIAHTTALAVGLKTLAIPGSGLNDQVLYPQSHRPLAELIIKNGGGLLSELKPDQRASRYSFPSRNRLMAGLSPATLIIEAQAKSGTLITARLALDYNRDVLCVPGSIFNQTAIGPLQLIKDGAEPIISADDLRDRLGFSPSQTSVVKIPEAILSNTEKIICIKLALGPKTKDEILLETDLPTVEILVSLSNLELNNFIKNEDGILYLQVQFAKD